MTDIRHGMYGPCFVIGGEMARNKSRGHTKTARHESYRIDAITYVQDRDAKIDEIVADIKRKYPYIAEADARRIVVEHWAALERNNDMRNTVRSLDFGYDERAMLDRLNGRLNGKLNDRFRDKIADSLSSRLPGVPITAYDGPDREEIREVIERAARAISVSTVASVDDVRSMLRQLVQGGVTTWPLR